MKCPVCDQNLSGHDIDSKMVHVNRCLDSAAGAVKLSARSTGSAPGASRGQVLIPPSLACPFCLKADACTTAHVKRCPQAKEVPPQKVLQVIESTLKANGLSSDLNGVRRVKNPTEVQPKAILDKKRPRKASDKHGSHQVLEPSQHRHQHRHHPSSTSRSNRSKEWQSSENHLRRVFEERKLLLKVKVAQMLDNCVIRNQVEPTSSSASAKDLPFHWKLASFAFNDSCYIVTGFEKYCQKVTGSNSEDNQGFIEKDTNQETETGTSCVPVEDKDQLKTSRAPFTFDHSNELLAKLGSIVNDATNSDLVINCSANDLVYAHRFIWKLHASADTHLLDLGNSLTTFDCRDFEKEVVLAFVGYCYTGKLSHNVVDRVSSLVKLAKKVGCQSLVNQLEADFSLNEDSDENFVGDNREMEKMHVSNFDEREENASFWENENPLDSRLNGSDVELFSDCC